MSKDVLKSAISLASQGKSYPALSLVRQYPDLATMFSKMVPAVNPPGFTNSGDMKTPEPNVFDLQNIAERTARNMVDAETVLQILPDLEMAGKLLVSSVLSPKDLLTVELTFAAPEGLLPSDVSTALTHRIGQYFEVDYNIKPLLPVILTDAFVKSGSYPIAVLPENSIDELINSGQRITMEALDKEIDRDGVPRHREILGPATLSPRNAQALRRKHGSSVSLETYGESRVHEQPYDERLILEELSDPANSNKLIDTYTSVVDNYSLLKVPMINQRMREQRVTKAYGGLALEKAFPSLNKLSDRELTALLHKSPKRVYRPIESIKTQERLNRRTVGSPLIMHLPSESVIPVYVPGNVKQHVGYFVLIDQDGNPLVRQDDNDVYAQLGARMGTGSSMATAMLNKVKANMFGFNCGNRDHLNKVSSMYGAMVEKDLLSRLRNGLYVNGVALASRPEVFRIMLARALAQQHTQLLYIPIENITYFAFNYTNDGVGRSILDEMKILTSIRSMLTYSNTMGAMKNSIGRTRVNIKLDEADPDPQKTIERYIHEVTRTRQQAFPLGITSPVDVTDYLQRAAFEFGFSGHPRIPDTAVEFSETNTNYVKIDADLDEDLKKRSIQKFGLPPQVVDAGFESEFATSIVSNNIMTAKTVITIQDQFIPQLEDHLHKVALNDEKLIRDLRKILSDQYEKILAKIQKSEEYQMRVAQMGIGADGKTGDDEQGVLKELIIRDLLTDFVSGFTVSLPRPSSVSLENQIAAFEKYMDGLDKALDYYVSTAILNSETLGDISDKVDVVKENIKAIYARRWMAENGLYPELSELTTVDESGRPVVNLYDEQVGHIKAMAASFNYMFKEIMPIKDAANAEAQARAEDDTTQGGAAPTTNDTPSTSSGSDDSSSNDDSPFGGGIPGLDDLGGGDESETSESDDTSAEGGEGSGDGGLNL